MDSRSTLVGNLVDNPRFTTTAEGTAVATLRLASTHRRWDKDKGEHVDGDTLYLDVTLWGVSAERAQQALRKGDRVVATGRLRTREYVDKNEVKRSVTEMVADAVGVDLGRHVVTIDRVERVTDRLPVGAGLEVDLSTGVLEPAGELVSA